MNMHSDLHRVGGGFSVRFTFSSPSRLDADWSPTSPNNRQMRRALPRYRAARDQFLRAVAARIGGGPAVCVELFDLDAD